MWETVLSLDSFIIKITFWSVFLLHSSLKRCNSRHIGHVSENWTCLTTIVSISPSILAKRPTKPFSSYIFHFFWCVLFMFLKFSLSKLDDYCNSSTYWLPLIWFCVFLLYLWLSILLLDIFVLFAVNDSSKLPSRYFLLNPPL